MRIAVGSEAPDMIIHLGDSICDAEKLKEMFPNAELISIPGNTDTETGQKPGRVS